MKKNLVPALFLFFASLFLFSGCKLVLSLLEGIPTVTDEEFSYSIDTSDVSKYKNSNWYLFKLNVSENYTIDPVGSGYISGLNSRNAVESDFEEQDEQDFSLDFSDNQNGIPKWNDTEIIRKKDEQVVKSIASNAARALVSNITSKIQTVSHSVGDVEQFWYAASDSSFQKENAVCKYSGKNCEVFFIDNNPIVQKSRLDFETLGKKFDTIYEKETQILGTNRYTTHSEYFIDPKSKITILVADLFNDAEKNQTGGTFGYFSKTDMYKSEYVNVENKTNENQIIYIDSYFYSFDGSKNSVINGVKYDTRGTIYSTLVHEFNHLLNFCSKTVNQNIDYETWYTEMLAMVAEDLFKDYLEITDDESSIGRLPYYFDRNTDKGFKVWLSGEDAYYSYANCFAYGAYLVRNYGGVELLSELALNNQTNEASITAALKKLGYNKTFEDTLMEFPMVLLNYDKTTGITLNKAAENSYDSSLKFDAIKLFPYKSIDSSGKTVKVDTPYFYKYTKGSGATLYPYGFTIHSIGKGISGFNYCKPSSQADEYIKGYIANDAQGIVYDTIY